MKWSEFTWSMDDMIFLLENLQSLKEGLSCFEPELLLVKPQGRKKPMANFIPACELAADIEIRLERANGDGTILKWHYTQGIEIVEIARGISCPASEVHYRICLSLFRLSLFPEYNAISRWSK